MALYKFRIIIIIIITLFRHQDQEWHHQLHIMCPHLEYYTVKYFVPILSILFAFHSHPHQYRPHLIPACLYYVIFFVLLPPYILALHIIFLHSVFCKFLCSETRVLLQKHLFWATLHLTLRNIIFPLNVVTAKTAAVPRYYRLPRYRIMLCPQPSVTSAEII